MKKSLVKIQSFNTFKKTHKRYHKSPILFLDHYGYTEVSCIEYDKGEQPKPKKEAIGIAKLLKLKDVVYRMTTYAWNHPWIVVYRNYNIK